MNTLQKAGTLNLLPRMTKINAIEVSIEFLNTYGNKIDWHEFSGYLDELRTKGILEIAKPGGMTEYKLTA